MAGLFFCLASDTVQGFYFALMQYIPIQAFTARFVPSMSYTANAVKQRTELYSGVSCDCFRSAAHDTRPIQSTITPLAPRWSVSQLRSASSTYQIPPSRRTLYRPAQPPYYNDVYKSATHHRPCKPGEVFSHCVRIAGKCCTRRTC